MSASRSSPTIAIASTHMANHYQQSLISGHCLCRCVTCQFVCVE